MADEQEPSGPSLEPPSLFRRKKKTKPAPSAPTAPPVDDSPTTILDETSGAEMTQPLAPPVPPTPAAPPPPLFVDESAAPPAMSSDQNRSAQAAAGSQSGSLDVAEPAAVPAPERVRKERSGPPVPGRVAAALAGVLVGGLVVGLTSASFELCSRIQGTNSCGGPGIFLLLAILVLAVALGTLVLRLCQVPEPGSTSFLAVGLTSVVALLFLVDALFEWWMVIVIPLVSVAAFLLSHWVTTTFVDPAHPVGQSDEPKVADHDVR
jgi:hypothetical protein